MNSCFIVTKVVPLDGTPFTAVGQFFVTKRKENEDEKNYQVAKFVKYALILQEKKRDKVQPRSASLILSTIQHYYGLTQGLKHKILDEQKHQGLHITNEEYSLQTISKT